MRHRFRRFSMDKIRTGIIIKILTDAETPDYTVNT